MDETTVVYRKDYVEIRVSEEEKIVCEFSVIEKRFPHSPVRSRWKISHYLPDTLNIGRMVMVYVMYSNENEPEFISNATERKPKICGAMKIPG